MHSKLLNSSGRVAVSGVIFRQSLVLILTMALLSGVFPAGLQKPASAATNTLTDAQPIDATPSLSPDAGAKTQPTPAVASPSPSPSASSSDSQPAKITTPPAEPADEPAGTSPTLPPSSPEPRASLIAPPAVQAKPIPGELLERRTESSRTINNKDGSFTVESFTGPIHFKDKRGAWQPIEQGFAASGRPGYSLRNKGNSFGIHLKDHLGADAVAVEIAGSTYTLTPQGLDRATGQLAGNGLSFSAAAEAVDISYEMLTTGLKETIVLNSAKAPDTFTFLLKGPEGTKLTPTSDGALVASDGKGKRVFVLEAPWAEEKSALESPQRTEISHDADERHATLSARSVPGGHELTLKVDQNWLRAPDRRFPVVVDPTVTVGANQDTFVQSEYPAGSTSGTGASLFTGTDDDGALRSLIKFDLGAVPAGSSVSGATMSTYWGTCISVVAGYVCDRYDHRIDVHRVTGAWSEGNATWDWLQGSHDRGIEASYTRLKTEKDGFNSWPLTNLVHRWVTGAVPNHGVMLRVIDETLGRGGPCYRSREHSIADQRPKLSITYRVGPNVADQLAPADATRFTATPTLSARYSSSISAPGKLEFVVKDAKGSEVATGSTAQFPSGSTGSFTPSALADATYYWQARSVDDAGGVSAWSAPQDFALAKVRASGPGIGEQRFYGLDSTGLTDRMGMSVNPANGNFLLSSSDLSVAGTGMALSVDRFYNSQSDSVYALGRGWTMGTGRDVGLSLAPDGSQQFEGPSGYRIMFTRNPDGSYVSPTGSDAVLTRNGDGSFKLFFNLSSSAMNFTSGGYLSSQKDMNANTISFGYNADSLLASITDTQDRIVTFAYTAGLLNTMTDSSGRQYKYAYDGAQNLITYTDPANKNTGFSYDANGRMTQITDPKGNLTKISYDASGRVTKTTRVSDNTAGTGPATSYVYNAGNTVATDANGNDTTSFFDTLGRITKVTDAAGKNTLTSYTPNSNVASATDTMGAVSNFGYDGRDNLMTATSPTGAGSTNAYAHSAHPYFASKATNAQGNNIAYAYDAPGNLMMSQNDLASDNRQEATFNPNGTMATSTDGNGNVTSYGYDPKGNLLTVSAPLGVGNKTYTYDGLSRVKTVTDNKAQTTAIDYDTLDRVTKLTFAGNATVINTYDDDGNLTKRDDNGGGLLEATVSTTFGYDRLNRQTAKTAGGVTFTSTFDGVGNLKTITDPPSGTISYSYNALNLLTELTEPAGAKTTFGYDDAYRRTRTSYPNGVVQTVTYDASGKTKTVVGKKADGTVLTSFIYDYVNPVTGNDTALVFKMTDAAGAATNYRYDVMDRLIDANGPTGHFEYSYDGNGNRLTQKINGVLTSYTSNAADQLTNAGATTYTYDPNGNRTGQSGGPTLTYNSKDQNIGYQLPAFGSPLIDMKYLGSSQKERSKAGPSTFTNGPQGEASTTTAGFLSSTTANYTRDDTGNLIGQRISSARYYYLFDRLGSVVAVTDSAGNAVNRYVYDPYGNALSGTVQAVVNPWQFVGGYKDGFSGFIKFGARYYDPVVGVWTQRDRLGACIAIAPFSNRYAYADGDPANRVDPTGYFATPFFRVQSRTNPGLGACLDQCDATFGDCMEAGTDEFDLELCFIAFEGCVEDCQRQFPPLRTVKFGPFRFSFVVPSFFGAVR